MTATPLSQAIALLESCNAQLEPEHLSAEDARALLQAYAKAHRLAAFGVAALTRKVQDAVEVARVTGTSVTAARGTVQTGQVLGSSRRLESAFRKGDVSLDQATEIAKAEQAAPGCTRALLRVAKSEPFHILKEKARKVVLDADAHRGLASRQREARMGRTYLDDLGMVHVHVALEPHVGTPIVARAEVEAQRLARKAKAAGRFEPFERHLADAYAALLSGAGKGRARRPELVVLVSHGIAKRGWKDVEAGEVCKIPGVGPISPQTAKLIAKDAFLNGVFYDGKDLRQFARWTRHIPVEVSIALELGEPPDFDGIVCVDCGNRFRTEFDHVEPRAAKGPTSNGNLKARCWTCHQRKTDSDRKSGKFKRRDAPTGPGRRRGDGAARRPNARSRPEGRT